MEPNRSLQDLHEVMILKIANALSAARLCSAGAPFCDRGVLLIVEDLEQALDAAREARAVADEVRQLVEALPYLPRVNDA